MKTTIPFRYAIPVAAAIMFNACGDSKHITNNPPEPYPTPAPEVTDYYVSPTCSDCRMTVDPEPGKGLYNILGHGYDVTENYLSAKALRSSVIDLTKQSDLGLIQIFSAPASSIGDMLSGSDSGEFLDALMANTGLKADAGNDVPCFNGTINSLSANSTFILTNNWIRSRIGKVLATSVEIPRTLSDEFIADTCRLKPYALVEKYGTHFLVNASLGVAVRTVYAAYVDAPESEKVALAYKGCQFAELSLTDKLASDLPLTLAGVGNYGATLTKYFCGGDPDLIEYDPETGKLGDTMSWQESMNPDNLALITLSERDLMPLSAAISDKGLRQQVDIAVSNYIRASKVNANPTIPLLQNTNGKIYRYVTSYDESLLLEERDRLKSFGMLGALYRNPTGDSLPLYSYVYPDGSQTLSLIQPTDSWECIGYVMPRRGDNTVSLYEISDGKRFAYTIEAANSYGPRNEWHPTGAVFYLLRP